MSKYPLVLFYRDDKDSYIDEFINKNIEKFNCSIEISRDTNKLFNPNYHVFITFGDNQPHFKNFPRRFSPRWIHTNKEFVENIERFNSAVNYNYIHNIVNLRRETSRPVFSIFTTCYNTYNKFLRVYNSVKAQKFSDWEWVILDDSESQEHFEFLKKFTKDDHRIRLFQRGTNSGNIGCVKNEAVSLCRGKYVLELDHDDEILPDCLKDAVYEFENDPDVGFVYMDFANLYENGKPFQYTEPICKGYGGYYWQYYKNNWIPVYITPNINNITLSLLLCCPNHPRVWRRDVLLECGNYSEYLPICDDFEILLNTLTSKYKVVKINKLAYIQYMNNDGNNFSLIRNKEINRLGPNHISPMFHKKTDLNQAIDEDNGLFVWHRETSNRKNTLVNRDFSHQKLIIGAENLPTDTGNCDILVLDNKRTKQELMEMLPTNVKFNSKIGFSEIELQRYFNFLYKNDNCDHEIIRQVNNYIVDLKQLDTNNINKIFTNAIPFNHVVIDNIVDDTILNNALNEINSIPDNELLSDYVVGIDDVQINKFCYRDFNSLKHMSYIKNYFESDIFIKWLEKITGIDNLQKDVSSEGGGIHIIKKNGKLAIHSDFNRHKITKQYRRLNLLLYLNKDYKEEYNGHLELWNKQMTSCEQKISPLFNRIVIFKVDDDANHGHPEIWNSENNNRTSLALYYYTNDRPEHEKSENYNAVWKTINKPKCFIIHNNTVGGAYKFLTDLMKTYTNYDYIFIDNRKQLLSIEFNKNDLFILQNVLYTDIEIDDIIAVHNFKLIIIVHDFQWLCQEQHKYTDDIPSSYLKNNISIAKNVKTLLSLADKVIMNSQFTYDVYSKYFETSNFIMCYPNDYNIHVGIKNIPQITNDCINIGIFSPLCKFKGEEYINYLKNKYENEKITFKIVGIDIPFYKETEFYDYIRKYNINGFLLLNKWGETYSYLLTKSINSGLPLLYNNIGSFKERIPPNNDRYFKVFDEFEEIDYSKLDTQFLKFIEYINTNNGQTEKMNEDFTISSNSVYNNIFLKIPKHIFQTSKETLPPHVKKLINMYCPEWEYSHFTDNECIQFFKSNPIPGFPNIVEKFNSFTQGQHKADLFRYYYLYLRGGVFLDSDAMFETNIKNIIQDYNSVFAKSYMKNEHLFNGFIATYPKNDIIYQALKHAYNTGKMKLYNLTIIIFVKNCYELLIQKMNKT